MSLSDEWNGFEAWARNAVAQPSFAGKYVRDGKWVYHHNIMQLMWKCWQAARSMTDEAEEQD